MLVFLLAAGCADYRDAESTVGWLDEGEAYGVTEPVAFTEDAYGFDGGIGALTSAVLPIEGTDIVYAPDENVPADSGCPSRVASEPTADEWTVRGVVTLHPRFYFKTTGCSFQSDEKYYGSYFIEDDTGGFFVLGDSKVAHFDVGNVVDMRVRALRTNFDQDMVYAHDIVAVDREVRPVSYVVPDDALGEDHVARVVRVEGQVVSEKDTFGEIRIESDNGVEHVVSLDVELNRRGVEVPLGATLRATGPVLYSYGSYSVIIMRVGQLEIIPNE